MSSSKQTLLCNYRYDPLDRLTSHAQSDTPQHHRFYCKSRLATEIQGAIGYSIVQHGDLLLAQQQRENDALDTTLLATDLQRSVLHTLKKNAERQPIAYSPYGHHRVESGLTSLLGFNGERTDPVTGHYLLGNGYRAFNPVLMRFNSPDSLSPFGKGGLNAYTYCLGDPVNLTDSNGHVAIPGPSAFSNLITRLQKSFGWTSKASKVDVPLNASAVKEISTPAFTFQEPASDMGLFGKLEGAPHILDNIIQQVPGSNMELLAQTSRKMHYIVYNASKTLPDTLTSQSELIRNTPMLDRIYSGVVPGLMPSQLRIAGIEKRGLPFMHYTDEGAVSPWSVRNMT
jgi:RHS repeat-associated protein